MALCLLYMETDEVLAIMLQQPTIYREGSYPVMLFSSCLQSLLSSSTTNSSSVSLSSSRCLFCRTCSCSHCHEFYQPRMTV